MPPNGNYGSYYGTSPSYPYDNGYVVSNRPPKKSHTGLIVSLAVGVPVLIILLTTICGAVIGSFTDNDNWPDDPTEWRTGSQQSTASDNASSSDSGDTNTSSDSSSNTASASDDSSVADVDNPDDIEAKVSSIPDSPDDNGDYTSNAEDIVAAAGMQLNWGLSDASRYCRLGSDARNGVVAGYCEQTPHVVYVNTRLYKEIQYDPYLANAMRHEIGHHVIDLRCDTAEPRIASTSYEAVTSSYAVLYLGASRRVLSETDNTGVNSYRMTTRTDEIARRIHAGQCE